MSYSLETQTVNEWPKATPITTLRGIAIKAARRLGDSEFEIWEQGELETYAKLGFSQFVSATGASFDSMHIPERHSPAYTPNIADRAMAESYRAFSPFSPSPSGSGGLGGAQSTLRLEAVSDPTPFLGDSRRESSTSGLVSYITSPADVPGASNTRLPQESFLPPDVAVVKRATWDGRLMKALTPQESDKFDVAWETLTGDTTAYSLIRRGINQIIKRFRPASTPADSRPYTDEVGFLVGGYVEPEFELVEVVQALRITLTPFAIYATQNGLLNPNGRISTFYPYPASPSFPVFVNKQKFLYGWPALDETSDYTVEGGPYGIPCRINGVWFTNAPYGIPIRFNQANRNLKIDFLKVAPETEQAIEIQPWDARILLWFVLSRAFRRDGKGQNLKLAGHYEARFKNGVAMVLTRIDNVAENAKHVMGEGTVENAPPIARLPTNYDSRYR